MVTNQQLGQPFPYWLSCMIAHQDLNPSAFMKANLPFGCNVMNYFTFIALIMLSKSDSEV